VDGDSFSIGSIAPGRYVLEAKADGTHGDWRAERITIDGREAVGGVLELGQGDTDTVIVRLTDATQTIGGRLLLPNNEAAVSMIVALFPSERRLWLPSLRRVRVARPATDGTFVFDDLAPGDYRMIALVDPDVEQLTDPEYLDTLVGPALQVSLLAGENKRMDLRTAW
jgi:hypothetical protein